MLTECPDSGPCQRLGQDEYINIGQEDYWILNSRTIKYLNQNQEEEIQKFVFEDICLLN